MEYSLILCNIKEDIDKELKYLDIFRRFRVDGILLMHEKINPQIKELLIKTDIPIVLGSLKNRLSRSRRAFYVNVFMTRRKHE